ncbi:MAG: hypothetical protein U0704_01655 [Candidatus Eisenbacteria bacterium]
MTKHAAAAVALAATTLVSAAQAGPSLTIYTHDLGFVRESRTLELRAARDTVRLEDVSSMLDFSSVRLAPANGRVTRLAYRWDVANGDALIERAVGQRVRVLSRGDRVAEGVLVAADGLWLVLRGDDGAIRSQARATVEEVSLANPGRALSLKPAIEAVVEGGKGSTRADLTYLTGGLSWSAEHTLVRTGENTATWGTVVQVQNTTGRAYADARLQLVAGEPSRTAAPAPKMEYAMMARVSAADAGGAPDPGMTEQAFADYHLYTLTGDVTLRDRETQSLVMYDPRPVQVTPRYLYRGGAQGVLSQLILVNDAKSGTGQPLPAGRVRFFEPDAAKQLQFTGETNIRHTASDEKLTMEVGTAFDLAAERVQKSDRRISDREREYSMEIKLRNRKSNTVTIVVEEPLGGDITVTQQSHPSVRKDAGTLQFDIVVPAGKEVVVTYTARQRW